MATDETVKENRNRKTTKKGCMFVLKRGLARKYLNVKHKSEYLIKPHDLLSDDVFEIGYLPTKEEELLEYPRKVTPNATDSVEFYGKDAVGNSVRVYVHRYEAANYADVVVRLSDGAIYRMPPTFRTRAPSDKFACSGLLLEVLEPMRRWKVSYNGFLVSGSNESYFKFTFIWSPIHQPFDSKRYFNGHLLSEEIAKEKLSLDLFNKVLSSTYDWYDQWGCMIGTIEIGNDDPIELHLRGKKLRQYGDSDFESIKKCISLNVYVEDGSVMFLKSETKINHPTILSGYVIYCNDAYEEILKTNFNQFLDEDCPNAFDLTIKTSVKTYELKLTISNDDEYLTYHGLNQEFQICYQQYSVSIDNFKGWASLAIGSQNTSQPPISNTISKHLLQTQANVNDDLTLKVVPFTSEHCRSPNVVGGKGAALAKMTSLQTHLNQFEVPRGLCVTVACYWLHVRSNPQIEKAFSVVKNIAWQNQPGNLKVECEKLSGTFRSTKLNEETEKLLSEELKTVFGNTFENLSFAVRSSAIGEDDVETSCAGQNDTFLGVTGLSQIFEAVIKCWASQFSYIAIEYKRQNGQLLDRGMGVVIQEMVPSEIAGVLFTVDPVSGSATSMTITANYGLGQSVVSSTADPDTICLQRTLTDDLLIQNKQLGKKFTKDVIRNDGGYETVDVLNEDRDKCCLTDSQILQLGNIGVLLENELNNGKGVDIEWAISNSQLYLLQSRAITSLNQDNNFILRHEFDSGLLTDEEPLTLANVGEVMPGATSPLAQIVITRMLNIYFKARFVESSPKVLKNVYYNSGLQFSQWHVLGNFVNMSTYGTMKEMTPMLKASLYGMIGKDIMSGRMYEMVRHRFGVIDRSNGYYMIKPGLDYMFSKNRRKRETLKVIENAYLEAQVDETPKQFYDRLIRLYLPYKKGMWFLMCGSTYSGLWGSIILNILLKGKTDVTNEIMSDYASLLGSGNDVISAEIPRILKTLADKLNPEEFLSMSTEEAIKWLNENKDIPGEMYKKLIKEYGHRCYKEFDIYHKSWAEDPTPIIKMLQTSLRTTSTTTALKKEESVEETISKLNTQLTNQQKRILRKIIPCTRNAVGARELAKSVCIQSIDVYRKGYRTLSKLLVQNGFLPNEELMYFLTVYEIGQLIDSRSPQLVNRAKRRKNIQPTLDRVRFPDVFCGYAKQVEDIESDYQRDDSTKVMIKATTACQGYIRATARVITYIEDAHQINAGDILITFSTDIGWSPYFPLLSGIVTEIGGIISHGAVIAREYGLPCLIAADNATKIFRSGDDVILDATKGTIELVK